MDFNSVYIYILLLVLGFGLKPYLTIFSATLLVHFGHLDLPGFEPEFINIWLISGFGILTLIESAIDKTEGFDSGNHLFHSFLTPVLVSVVVLIADFDSFAVFAVALLLASYMHAAKYSIRIKVNTTSHKLNSVRLSMIEDAIILLAFALFIYIKPLFLVYFSVVGLVYTILLVKNYHYYTGLHSFIYKIFTKPKSERL